MNLAQARALTNLLLRATPPPGLHDDQTDPRPTAWGSTSYENSDLCIRLLCQETTLARFPEYLYIDEDGVLYDWDNERPEGQQKVPCTVKWRYGMGDTYQDRRHYRYLDVIPVEPGVEAAR